MESSFADRVFFSNSGTEANEAAIKFSRKFQRYSKPDEPNPASDFITFTNSFHGRTMGALALTSKDHYRDPFQPVMPGATFIEYGNTEAARNAIQAGKTAAVFVEPIQGEGGIHSATKEFLESLRSACDDAGALLVFDEVCYSMNHGLVIRLNCLMCISCFLICPNLTFLIILRLCRRMLLFEVAYSWQNQTR